jgi:hypothetical protein
VAVKSYTSIIHNTSTSGLEQVQYHQLQSANFKRFQWNLVRDRGAEVQILSPRPNLFNSFTVNFWYATQWTVV